SCRHRALPASSLTRRESDRPADRDTTQWVRPVSRACRVTTRPASLARLETPARRSLARWSPSAPRPLLEAAVGCANRSHLPQRHRRAAPARAWARYRLERIPVLRPHAPPAPARGSLTATQHDRTWPATRTIGLWGGVAPLQMKKP